MRRARSLVSVSPIFQFSNRRRQPAKSGGARINDTRKRSAARRRDLGSPKWLIHSPTWPGRSPSGWARKETSDFAGLNHINAANAFRPCSRHASTSSRPLTQVASASRSFCVQPNPPSPALAMASSSKPTNTSACSALMPPRSALSTTDTMAALGHCDGSMRVLRTVRPFGVRNAKENAVRSWVTDTNGPAA